MALYSSSLLSNWLGNGMFIYIALALKSNSTDVPPALTPEVLGQIRRMFAAQGLEFTVDNIRNMTSQMREVSQDLKKDLRERLDAQSRETQSL
jgi:hypothetical protein